VLKSWSDCLSLAVSTKRVPLRSFLTDFTSPAMFWIALVRRKGDSCRNDLSSSRCKIRNRGLRCMMLNDLVILSRDIGVSNSDLGLLVLCEIEGTLVLWGGVFPGILDKPEAIIRWGQPTTFPGMADSTNPRWFFHIGPCKRNRVHHMVAARHDNTLHHGVEPVDDFYLHREACRKLLISRPDSHRRNRPSISAVRPRPWDGAKGPPALGIQPTQSVAKPKCCQNNQGSSHNHDT
jgi:hypothetical protein